MNHIIRSESAKAERLKVIGCSSKHLAQFDGLLVDYEELADNPTEEGLEDLYDMEVEYCEGVLCDSCIISSCKSTTFDRIIALVDVDSNDNSEETTKEVAVNRLNELNVNYEEADG